MNKYKKWYSQITQNGKTSKDEGNERHHIVPRSLGGNDDPQNIAFITPREHFICHWLLTKIYHGGEDHWKMINAFRMMRAENPNQQRYSTKVTSRVYENLKREYSILQSERMTGENNPMWGKTHSDKARRLISEKNTGKKLSEEQIARQVDAQTGRKRKPFSDEWKAKMSVSKLGENNNRYGVTVSEDTKQKIREKAIGRKQSAETIQKKADAIRGVPKPKKLCSHCGQMIAVNTYSRWHGANCRNINTP
jgi:hypothetical protein